MNDTGALVLGDCCTGANDGAPVGTVAVHATPVASVPGAVAVLALINAHVF